MWRKSSEARPNATASNRPAPAPAKPQETPQASSPLLAPAMAVQQATTTGTTTEAAAPANGIPAKDVAAVPDPQPVASGGSSTISAGLKIKGEITGTSDLTIDGETQGKLRVDGRVTVGASGRVNSDIEARDIVVYGTVQGNLKASESVRLGPSGRVVGSVLTRRIGIDDGARLRGHVEMIRVGQAPGSAEEEPANSTEAVRAASAED